MANPPLHSISSVRYPWGALLSLPSQETAGFADAAQRARHNFGKKRCRPTGSSSNQPAELASQPSAYSNGMQTDFYKSSRAQATALAVDDRHLEKIPTSHRGVELLALVKEGIVYQRIAEDYQPSMEKQSIQIQLLRRWWATIHNHYATPIRGQDTLAIALTEPGNPFLAGGDLNAHSLLWEEHHTADQRGELVEDWLLSQNASIPNGGSAKCVNTILQLSAMPGQQ